MLPLPWYKSGVAAAPASTPRARFATMNNFPVSSNKGHPTPWDNPRCAACSSELDCRDSTEYCDRDGCCRKGECSDAQECISLSSLTNYYIVEGFDSPGNDLNAMHPQDNLNVLEAACSANPGCVGYTSYGMLKHEIEPPSAWIPEPTLKGLTPWVMYIKKTAVDQKNPLVKFAGNGGGIKTYCASPYASAAAAAAAKTTNTNALLFLRGVCRECLACNDDATCPVNMMCDATRGCCVNNPCYVATAEDGAWVDAHYAHGNQCANCAPGEDYCCQKRTADYSDSPAFCSATPCAAANQLVACSYICEDPAHQHDAVFCKANETCCAATPGHPPVCAAPGAACPPPSTA